MVIFGHVAPDKNQIAEDQEDIQSYVGKILIYIGRINLEIVING